MLWSQSCRGLRTTWCGLLRTNSVLLQGQHGHLTADSFLHHGNPYLFKYIPRELQHVHNILRTIITISPKYGTYCLVSNFLCPVGGSLLDFMYFKVQVGSSPGACILWRHAVCFLPKSLMVTLNRLKNTSLVLFSFSTWEICSRSFSIIIYLEILLIYFVCLSEQTG